MKKNKKPFYSTDWEKEVGDMEEFESGVNLQPNIYIHATMLQLIRVFDTELSESDAFSKYIHLVGHLEMLCQSTKLKDNDYKEKVEKLAKDAKEKFPDSQKQQEAWLNREKFGLLATEIFSNNKIYGALSLYTNQDGTTSRQKETSDRVEATKQLIMEGKIKSSKGDVIKPED